MSHAQSRGWRREGRLAWLLDMERASAQQTRRVLAEMWNVLKTSGIWVSRPRIPAS
jgi:hypothetical protein